MEQIQAIIEAALFVAGRPLPITQLQKLFDDPQPLISEIRQILTFLQEKYQNSGLELRELASGFQFQAKSDYSYWLAKLWEERPERYSRALLETLALIAYRQPITRSEIEAIRGVTVSSHIIKTLLEREWIQTVGFRDTPGKPVLYATTRFFLDHFNLKNLSDLPQLPLDTTETADTENTASDILTPAPSDTIIAVPTE